MLPHPPALASPPAAARPRRPLEGTLNVVRFNWPFYLGAALAGLAAAALLWWGGVPSGVPRPAAVRGLAAAGLAAGLYFALASLAASWWTYDASGLYSWRWLPGFAAAGELADQAALNVHSGFDETSLALRAQWPAARWETADLFDALPDKEASIRRARRRYPAPVPARPVRPDALPYPDGHFAAVFLLFAAHEIREPEQRAAFFGEVARVLAPGGRAVLVEHRRDWANALAFGPGVAHFYPAAEWTRRGRAAGLRLRATRPHRPFVSAWLWEKPGPAA